MEKHPLCLKVVVFEIPDLVKVLSMGEIFQAIDENGKKYAYPIKTIVIRTARKTVSIIFVLKPSEWRN